MSAVDNDVTSPNNQVLYRIESGARDKFRIDSLSGAISVESGASLDRDVYGATYTLSVVAIDRGKITLRNRTRTQRFKYFFRFYSDEGIHFL